MNKFTLGDKLDNHRFKISLVEEDSIKYLNDITDIMYTEINGQILNDNPQSTAPAIYYRLIERLSKAFRDDIYFTKYADSNPFHNTVIENTEEQRKQIARKIKNREIELAVLAKDLALALTGYKVQFIDD